MLAPNSPHVTQQIEELLTEDPRQVLEACAHQIAELKLPLSIAEIQHGFQNVDCPLCFQAAHPKLGRFASPHLFEALSALWNHSPRAEFAGRSPVEQYRYARLRGQPSNSGDGYFEDFGSRLVLSMSAGLSGSFPMTDSLEQLLTLKQTRHAGGRVATTPIDGGASDADDAKPELIHVSSWLNSETPRNARCPCGSGRKFKNCCGDTRVAN
ncbi:MAG: YecA family protein [Planctomycetota bacterium]